MLDTNILFGRGVMNNFFQAVICLFIFLTVFLEGQKTLKIQATHILGKILAFYKILPSKLYYISSESKILDIIKVWTVQN